MAPRPDLRDVEDRLGRVLVQAVGLLPEEQLRDMRDLVEAGEPGVALENFCTQLYEHDAAVTEALAAEVTALAAAMGLRVTPPLVATTPRNPA